VPDFFGMIAWPSRWIEDSPLCRGDSNKTVVWLTRGSRNVVTKSWKAAAVSGKLGRPEPAVLK
jgi:hypothetical protein